LIIIIGRSKEWATPRRQGQSQVGQASV